MKKGARESGELHNQYTTTDGKIVGVQDGLLGTRYVWRETIPVATTRMSTPRYRLSKSGSIIISKDEVSG